MSIVKDKMIKVVAPKLQADFGYKNKLALPGITKVTINVGIGKGRDPKFIETIVTTLRRISGQEPVKTKARKSIAGFKLREGSIVGAFVTLRGEKMWSFLDKLANVAFARVRDFQGLPDTVVDKDGNFNFGFTEHTAFPEIAPDEIESLHGVQVTITTTAHSRPVGLAIFTGLGFPIVTKKTK
ncbi:MAG: 50S ribosomal protein L5 [Patescibacteria group bacterium]